MIIEQGVATSWPLSRFPGTWGEDTLFNSNESWTTTIPSSLKPGAYVLRHEIIALHSARSAGGAQNYVQCVNLMVSGSGTATINGVLPETFYTPSDPGIQIDIYNSLSTYQIPGPTVQVFGGAGGGAAPTTTSAAPTSASSTSVAPTTTKPSTTLVTTTKVPTTTTTKPVTSSTSAAGAPLYGQCGGVGWTGPTICALGTCKATNQ